MCRLVMTITRRRRESDKRANIGKLQAIISLSLDAGSALQFGNIGRAREVGYNSGKRRTIYGKGRTATMQFRHIVIPIGANTTTTY